MSFESLPVIIVSAKTTDAANEFITELIDADVTEEVRPAGQRSCDRVWRLQNKYYTCEVRVRPAPPVPPAPPGGGDAGAACEAHVALLAEDEVEGREPAGSRLAGGARAAVRVLACRAPRLPPALHALCAASAAHPVPLHEAEEEGGGLRGVRDALHAHVWRGARPAGGGAGEGAGQSAVEEGAVERAERFAAALGALGGGAAHVRALEGAARRDAAERLVAAFAAALGEDLDDGR